MPLTLLVRFVAVAAVGVGVVPDGALVRVHAIRVTPTATGELYRTSGTVRGPNTAQVTSKVTGTVREVRVRAGDEVTKGQTLAVLDSASVEASLQGARAQLRAANESAGEAEEAVGAAAAEARVAAATFARNRNLLAERAVTRQEFDESESRERSARAGLAMAHARKARAQAGIEQARAGVAAAEAALADTRIVAPFSGLVIERHVDPGSLASPSAPLFLVDQRGPLRVEAPIEESLASQIKVGDRAEVAIGERSLQGRVGEVVPSIDPTTRAFLVKIDLPAGSDGELRPGMYVRASFHVGTAKRLLVPRAAISEAGALDRVFVVENGRAQLRLVTLGAQSGSEVEVLSGLNAGDIVITAPPDNLRDGAPVEVTN